MQEIHSRCLADGSGTVITLSDCGDGTYSVSAVNPAGASSAVLESRADAALCFKHPFSRRDWLDYPGLEG